ncbi:mannose-1-phosphate guanylyltransferase/mannose-6-phosphate isomerase [Thauera sp. ZXT1-4]|uniref:mannose-1-phosphate guanylyltransferase/mannose-6-phosphate isomerase n=1 Tax=Thauera sp. ZXT1-4 TaxID=3460294 RepID=UPI004040BA81
MILQAVVLCGGSGTRLWPLSREAFPKQLLALDGAQSMLQVTAKRLDGLANEAAAIEAPILVGNEEYRFLIAEQLRQVGVKPAALVLEPCGRNTAPALTLAARVARAKGADPVLVVMPADHVIKDGAVFQQAVARAAELAEAGKLVTFGIVPQGAETGYGYIRLGERLGDAASVVERFVEKPDLETAKAYVESGQYLWNSGIFVIKASVWLDKIAHCRPDIATACGQAFDAATHDADFLRPGREAFEACPSDSIDYAVMERLTADGANHGEVVVVPLDAKWSDVGAWSALWEIGDKDASGNVLAGDVIAVDTENTYVRGERLIATVGLKDTVVVETADAILVADRNQIQKVKDVVGRLRAENRTVTNLHRKVYRPWGWYDSIDFGPRFQVKRIVVNPGGVLSLQMHHHRAEHWIVVSGTARVTKGDESLLLAENESTYIPLGVTHRLENPGKLPLELIEVQSGSYLGEDDIVRFEDNYGRAK